VSHSAFGPRFSGSAYADDGNIATLRTTDLDDDGRISYETMPLAVLNEDRFANHLLNVGDLVITRSGTCGIAAVFEGFNLPVLPGAFLIRFRLNDSAESRFYRYYFNAPLGRQNILSVARGAVQQNLNITSVEALRVPLPPLSEQRHIVNLLSAYDDLIENNRRRMALLEDAARQLYREWFVRLRFPGHEHTRITNGVPEGWEQKRLGDVSDCVGGGTPSTSVSNYWDNGDVTWVTPTDVTRNENLVLLDSGKKITEAGLQNSSAKIVPAHSVLMTSRASVGFFAVAGREVCTNQGFISVVAHDRTLWPYFLFHLSERVEEIRSMGSGSTYPEVSRGKFREFELLLPKHSLSAAFGKQATDLLSHIRILKQQNEKLRAARDLLLPRLMSGEIAV